MRYKILLVLCLSLLLVACEGDEKTTQEGGAFLGGTQGVVVEFEPFGVEEGGVYAIYDTEQFPLEVTVRNKGEYQIQPGDITVKMLGPAPNEFSGIASRTLQNTDLVDKISDLVPEGGEETISFAGDAKYESIIKGSIDRDWLANLEYKYQTQVIIPEVCLKEDLTDKRVCTVREPKNFFVSGAPITVTAVKEDTAGKGIIALKVTVSNVGGGDKVRQVGGEFGVNDEIAYSIDDPAWECKSSGRVNQARLREGTAEIVCKLKEALNEGDLFTKQVTLTLEYVYRSVVRETLRIKESAR
jgi:hypothetical protein